MYAEKNINLWGRIINKPNHTKSVVNIPVLLLPVLHHQSMRFVVRRNNSWEKKKIKIKNINNCKEESYFLYLSSFQYSTSCVFVPSFHLFWKVSAEWFLYTTAVHFLKFYTLSEVTENIYIQLTNAKILFTAVLITLLTENYFTHCIRD